MFSFEKYTRTYNAPVVVATVIGAAATAAATVYTQRKAEEAADKKAEADSVRKKEMNALNEAKASAEIDRTKQQGDIKEAANSEAELAQANTMKSAAEAEKRSQDLQRELAKKQAHGEYAAKFKPGQGGEGEDSVVDFLVPKMDNDTGLIRKKDDSGNGLITPLTFGGNYV